MTKNKTKLYCYVDETGQDGLQKFFLVSVVITDSLRKAGIEEQLEAIELRTGKKKLKWTKTKMDIRKLFIEDVARMKNLKNSIFYSMYPDGKAYTHLTSLSVAKAVFAKKEDNYTVTVIIDGLTKKDTEKVRNDLKQLKVKYDNIRGMKDEQSAFIRLADCFAGFIRDYIEKQPYAKPLFNKLKEKEIVLEA
ncbi:MAG TPA: DUF3800 domain-containing protein [Patescibacteria group bacterium]|jgi:hypothetical protein|nr:DUF3800 domain-containing protein [Patescibacteria group bacterium]